MTRTIASCAAVLLSSLLVAQSTVAVFVDGKALEGDAGKPHAGTVYVPIRNLAASLGYSIEFSGERIQLTMTGWSANLGIGILPYVRNGEERVLPKAVIRRGNKIWIPVESISSAFAAEAAYSRSEKTVRIQSIAPPVPTSTTTQQGGSTSNTPPAAGPRNYFALLPIEFQAGDEDAKREVIRYVEARFREHGIRMQDDIEVGDAYYAVTDTRGPSDPAWRPPTERQVIEIGEKLNVRFVLAMTVRLKNVKKDFKDAVDTFGLLRMYERTDGRWREVGVKRLNPYHFRGKAQTAAARDLIDKLLGDWRPDRIID